MRCSRSKFFILEDGVTGSVGNIKLYIHLKLTVQGHFLKVPKLFTVIMKTYLNYVQFVSSQIQLGFGQGCLMHPCPFCVHAAARVMPLVLLLGLGAEAILGWLLIGLD